MLVKDLNLCVCYVWTVWSWEENIFNAKLFFKSPIERIIQHLNFNGGGENNVKLSHFFVSF